VDRTAERERLRRTFDAVATDYQDARPEYPAELYAELLNLTGARPGADRLCEVGSASGKATLPLARRGFAITCVELGAALAAEARRNLAGFDRVTVVHDAFERWRRSATSPCAGSTGRSGRGWRGGRTGNCGGTGARCCTWRGPRSSVSVMASAQRKRRLAVLAAIAAGYAAGTVIATRQGYSFGRNTVVKCRQGHLFSTVWIPGASVKSLRLGFWRYQWCPVGRHLDLVRPVKAAELTEAGRSFALAHHDIPVP